MERLASVAILAACGATPTAPAPKQHPLLQAAGKPGAIRKLMRGSVTNAGLWFDDSECLQKFPLASEIHEDRMDDFARCLAKLQLQVSMRTDPLPDATILTYPPGLEIEALVLDEEAGPHLVWIGYVSRRDRASGLPSIAPEVLESLRAAGDRNGPLAPDVATQIGDAYAWLDVCIDGNGEVTSAHPRLCSSRKAARAFGEATTRWKFKPYQVHGQPLPVCSLLKLRNPPGEKSSDELPYPEPEHPHPGADEGVVVSPKELTLVKGDKYIEPDDVTKTGIQIAGVRRIVATLKVCIDGSGHVTGVRLLRASGVTRYDQKLVTTVSTWVYAPYVEDGQAIPVCTGLTFIYSQH